MPAGFTSNRALAMRCVDDGATTYASFRKNPAIATSAGFWVDLSMAPGYPRPNYYASAPQVGAPLAQSTDGGLYHGGAVAPSSKHLRQMMVLSVAAGAVPLAMRVCDYLLFYPFIDESLVGEEQPLTNPVPLPRSADGAGVQMMCVVVAAHSTTGTTIAVTYTNQAGVPGRVTPAVNIGSQAANGTILNTAPASANCIGPFLPLQAGDTGVRSAQSVLIGGVGDVGLFTLVLVKPIASLALRGIDAPVEVNFVTDRPMLPRIEDDAYLNLLVCPTGSLSSAPIFGELHTVWS